MLKLRPIAIPTLSTIKIQRWQTQVATATKIDDHNEEWLQAKPMEEMPFISSMTLIRNSIPGGKYYNLDVSKLIMAMRDDYGDISRMPALMGRPEIVTTHNPKDFEVVFRNEGVWPHRMGSDTLRYHREQHRRDFYEGIEGLIPSNGKAWGDFRSIVNPVLMQPKTVRLYYKKMSQVNKEFVERIKALRDPDTLEVPKDFEDCINRWTLESVSVVALDRQLGLLTDAKDDKEGPTVLFQSLKEFFELTADLEIKPSPWRYISTPKFKKLMKAFDNMQDIILKYVAEALDRLEDESKRGIVRPENEQSVLEKLLKVDKKVATVMALDMLMAGVDTTSSTFTSVLLALAKNPEKQEKLREEVMKVLPEKDSEFTEASMKNVPYLRACVKESQRIYPLVVGNGRTTAKDCVLSGYRVPANTFVSMIPLGALRNEKYFLKPNDFLPERWLRQDSFNDLKLTDPFVFLPFGFGPRMCVGKRIVDMELELGIARLIRNFHIEFNYPTENAFRSVLINIPNIPLQFKFSDTAK